MDRNPEVYGVPHRAQLSLSARRAWIEIHYDHKRRDSGHVALRKESVDRNFYPVCRRPQGFRSLSARRAWIEICPASHEMTRASVALRKESVDRNRACITTTTTCIASLSARRAWIEIQNRGRHNCARTRRSPQGERG